MKKILFVIPSLENGGAEKSLVNLLNELPSDMYDISLLMFRKEGMFLPQVPENVHIVETPNSIRKLYSRGIKSAGAYSLIKLLGTLVARLLYKDPHYQSAFRWRHFYRAIIKKLPDEYDVVLSYFSGETMFFCDEKVSAKDKYVWIHNDYKAANHPKEFDYEYLKRMRGIVSISDECVAILKREFPEFANKTVCIENITSSLVTKKRAAEFYPEEMKATEFNILSVGRLMEQKGFDMAIKAAAILRDKGFKFKWFVVGNGPLEEELTGLINANQLGDCFILLGPKTNPYAYMKNCDLFVQSSRYEGKSVVLDEAKILSKPIVVTNYPTVHDQIKDEEGLIIEMTPEGIASGIERLITDTSKREQISSYLEKHDYGNQKEVYKYVALIEGKLV